MALFGRNKKTEEAKPVVAAQVAETKAPARRNLGEGRGNFSHVLKNPRITEKATMQQGLGVYAFDVADNATKQDVAAAVRQTYKVSPRKVRIVAIPSKTTRSMRTGRAGLKSGGKKAYVYLKSGETITIS
ncbi:MAG TPA: 50S ribosomal protein L23 [Candidatus Paceibacterota bacterium]|nr:50S ribosomal protein L23 [Candidatus Paceibacterota bacterium]